MRLLASLLLFACGLSLVAAPLGDEPHPAPPPVPIQKGDDEEPIYRVPPGELVPLFIEELYQNADVADWGHQPLAVPRAWEVSKGKGVVVAVLDTGADKSHPDLKDQIVDAKDFTGSRNGFVDVQGHSTHCSGIIAAAENGMGMVGVAPEAKILIGKVLGDNGSGSSYGIAKGIRWAVDWVGPNGEKVGVISMSLGGGSPDADTQSAVKYAVERGVIVVAAAGNEGPGEQTVAYPGGYPECVCVGAIDDKLNVARFSSRGKQLFVAAPGVNVRSCYPGGRYATMSGTSMATPYVAGVAALWVSANPGVPLADRPAAFKKALVDTVIDLGPSGRDTAYGFGLVQPAKMLGNTNPMPPMDPPTPKPPTKIRFGLDDFTDSGKEKLRQLNPDLESIEFTLKPKE